jgi:hypothetical protein
MTNYARALFLSNTAEERVETPDIIPDSLRILPVAKDRRGFDLISRCVAIRSVVVRPTEGKSATQLTAQSFAAVSWFRGTRSEKDLPSCSVLTQTAFMRHEIDCKTPSNYS